MGPQRHRPHVVEQPATSSGTVTAEPAGRRPRPRDVARDEVDPRLRPPPRTRGRSVVREGAVQVSSASSAEPQPARPASGWSVGTDNIGSRCPPRSARSPRAAGLGLGVLEAHRRVQRRRRRRPSASPRRTPHGLDLDLEELLASHAMAAGITEARAQGCSDPQRLALGGGQLRAGHRPAPGGPRSRRRARAATRRPRSSRARRGRGPAAAPRAGAGENPPAGDRGLGRACSSPAHENDRRRATSRKVSSRRGSIALMDYAISSDLANAEFQSPGTPPSDEWSGKVKRPVDRTWQRGGAARGPLLPRRSSRSAASPPSPKRADAAARLSTTYVDARPWVTEASRSSGVTASRRPAPSASHDTAQRRFVEDLHKVMKLDTSVTRETVSRMLKLNWRYDQASRRLARPSTRTTRSSPCSSTFR